MIRRRPLAALSAVFLVIAACGTGKSSPSVGGASPIASAAASSEGASFEPSLAAGQFVNPVIREDFPDPFVMRVDRTYYAYATNNGGEHVQVRKSSDLVTWEHLPDALPQLPAWSSGDTWAPEVAQTSAGYVLYYTAHDSDLRRPDSNGAQCVTVGVSAAPEGPFVDDSKAPLVCQPTLGGSIDATAFVDEDGSRYLIWKNDGNCCRLPTRFFIQPLTANGLKLTGKPADMGVVNNEQWEGGVIEAPTLLLHDGTYYLFYSANGYDSEFYSIGYATSKTLAGPYGDAPENPVVSSAWNQSNTSRARGPGHQSIVEDDDGELWLAFHAWDEDAVGYANGGMRTMWIDKLTFNGAKPVVDGPKDGPQPVP